MARNPRVALAIAIPVLLMVAAVAVTMENTGHPVNTANTTTAANAPFGRGGAGGDLATAPVDGAGAAISLSQTPAAAAASMNCSLVVPASPLSARGLATPWQLADGCQESNVSEQAFVEATILSPAGGLTVYNPLVVTQGTQPAAAPVAPTIAAGSEVIINIGFNGTNLVLTGAGARQGNCVDALGQSVLGQVSGCNAAAFYRLANTEIARGTLKIPAAGTGKDGQPCLVTRDFGMVDQDPSDNVNTTYLLNADGQTAQDTVASAQAMAGSTPIANGSDNALLTKFLDGALGCTALTAPSPTTAAGMAASQALDELSASRNQPNPAALVPTNDEMTLVNGQFSVAKTNVSRSLVDQPPLPATSNATQVAAAYCQDMVDIQPARSQVDMALEAGTPSPVPSVGNNLATFLGNRLSMSFANLNCQDFGLTNPVTVTTDGNGVATAVTYSTAQQTANVDGTPAPCPAPGAGTTPSVSASAAGTATPSGTASAPAPATPTPGACGTPSASGAGSGRHGHRHVRNPRTGSTQNPSGM